MAERYWVGGTDTWNNVALLKWSTTSGGTPGAAAPGSSDNVYFDGNSGNVVVTTGASIACKNLSFTGFTGEFAGTNTLTVGGNLVLANTMTRSFTGRLYFNSALTTNTITTNTVSLASTEIQFLGGGEWTLTDDLNATTSYTYVTIGKLHLAGFSLTTSTFASNNNNARTVDWGTNGTINVAGAGTTWLVGGTGLVLEGTGIVDMSSSSSKVFAGASYTYPINLNQAGIGTLTVTGSNTFNTLSNTTQPSTVQIPTSTTTVGSISISGTSGNQISIQSSTAGTRATLNVPTGTVSFSYCSIKDIAAVGGALFNAYVTDGNVNNGNNIGIDFFTQVGEYMYSPRKSKRILISN